MLAPETGPETPTIKQRVIQMHAAHPDWRPGQIARALGLKNVTVRSAGHGAGIKFRPRRPERRSDEELRRRLLARTIPEPNSGCWLWIGALRSGYGNIDDGKTHVSAHRLAHELYIGPIPLGMVVMHRCDVRCCVNPDHLQIGTQLDNTRDCIAKGRARRGRFPGENSNHARLTWEQVDAIRAEPKVFGYRQRLADRYGVSKSCIGKVATGIGWREEDRPTSIPCECCEGIGLVEKPGSWGDYGSRIPEVVECPLCLGSGKERADVQPREPK